VVLKISIDIGYVLVPECDKCMSVFWVFVSRGNKWNKLAIFSI